MSEPESCLVDAYVIDTLMRDLVGHDRRQSAFLVYLYLWRRTAGGERWSEPLSLQRAAEATGLSKRATQQAVALLLKRELIGRQQENVTAAPTYQVRRPWAVRS